MSKITSIDGFDFDHSVIPPANVSALIASALGHKMRNEVASKVIGKLRSEALKDLEEKDYFKADTKDGKEALKASVAKSVKFDEDSEAHKAIKHGLQAEMAKVILEGTIGESAGRGPSLTPLQVKVVRIVRERVLAVLRTKKIWNDAKRVPKEEQEFVFPDGARTFADLQKGFLAKHGEAVAKEAQAELDREARAAAKVAASVESEGLGF